MEEQTKNLDELMSPEDISTLIKKIEAAKECYAFMFDPPSSYCPIRGTSNIDIYFTKEEFSRFKWEYSGYKYDELITEELKIWGFLEGKERVFDTCLDAVKSFKNSPLEKLSEEDVVSILGKRIYNEYEMVERSLKKILKKNPRYDPAAYKFLGMDIEEKPKEVSEEIDNGISDTETPNKDVSNDLKELKEEKKTLLSKIGSLRKDIIKKIKELEKDQKVNKPGKSIFSELPELPTAF